MALYSALIPEVEAIQWFKNGDHPDDHVINNINSGRVVARHQTYAANNFTGATVCPTCKNPISLHGVIVKPSEFGKATVCPGDYIEDIKDRKGRTLHYKLWKRKTFEEQYVIQPKQVEGIN